MKSSAQIILGNFFKDFEVVFTFLKGDKIPFENKFDFLKYTSFGANFDRNVVDETESFLNEK